MSAPCEFKEEIITMGKNLASLTPLLNEYIKAKDEIVLIGKEVASMKSTLLEAVDKTSNHIESGTRWRLAIVCSCVGLIGILIAGVVRFSVVEMKSIRNDEDIKQIRNQIYDLNYSKGYSEGLAQNERKT